MGGLGGGDEQAQDLTLDEGMKKETVYIVREESNPDNMKDVIGEWNSHIDT